MDLETNSFIFRAIQSETVMSKTVLNFQKKINKLPEQLESRGTLRNREQCDIEIENNMRRRLNLVRGLSPPTHPYEM